LSEEDSCVYHNLIYIRYISPFDKLRKDYNQLWKPPVAQPILVERHLDEIVSKWKVGELRILGGTV